MANDSEISAEARPSRDSILNDVRRIVAEQVGVPAEQIRETDELENDLGCDSLTQIEITMELEEQFDIQVSDEVMEKVRTVGDVVDGVVTILGHTSVNCDR